MIRSVNTPSELPFERELLINPGAHQDLHATMLNVAETCFSNADVVRNWHLRGLPLKNGALAGKPESKRQVEYHFLDVLASYQPLSMDDSVECALSFHGHPLDYSLEAIYDRDQEVFTVHPDAGRHHRVAASSEVENTETLIERQEMFEFLFGLLGHKQIPSVIQHPDSIDFNTGHALESAMMQLSETGQASSEVVLDRAIGLAIVGGCEVQVSFDKITQEHPRLPRVLRLVASTAMRLEEVTITKQLIYSFMYDDRLDGDFTSARLKLSSRSSPEELAKINLTRLVKVTKEKTEESFAVELMKAIRTIQTPDFESELAS